MTCPNPDCRRDFDPLTWVRGVTICPSCLRSVTGDVLAGKLDTHALTDSELADLRRLRGQMRKVKA